MARETDVTCPSGLKVKLRSVKGKDLDGMRDKRKATTGEATTSLLNDCTVEVQDRSIYANLKEFNWADALVGDRTYATVALKALSSGEEFEFRTRCKDGECRRMINWAVNMNELEVHKLSEESKACFLNGNVFETIAAGRHVKFRLNTGRDQLKLTKLRAEIEAENRKRKKKQGEEEKQILLGIGMRIVSVEGTDDVLSWLEELDLQDMTELLKELDKPDCGLETEIEIQCTGVEGCGLTQAVNLPLDSRFFAQAV